MPKNYVLKAETGKFESEVGGDKTNVLELLIMIRDLISALQASNNFMVRVAFHTTTHGHIDQTINIEILDQMIRANEDALEKIGAK